MVRLYKELMCIDPLRKGYYQDALEGRGSGGDKASCELASLSCGPHLAAMHTHVHREPCQVSMCFSAHVSYVRVAFSVMCRQKELRHACICIDAGVITLSSQVT